LTYTAWWKTSTPPTGLQCCTPQCSNLAKPEVQDNGYCSSDPAYWRCDDHQHLRSSLPAKATSQSVIAQSEKSDTPELVASSGIHGGRRRFRIELIQHGTLDVDCLVVPGDDTADTVRILADELIAEARRNPNGWQARFERMYPEMNIGDMKVGVIADIGIPKAP
jgi:hypothetical protein